MNTQRLTATESHELAIRVSALGAKATLELLRGDVLYLDDRTSALTPDQLNVIQGCFVRNRQSYTGWCRANGVNPTNARTAIFGVWNGPKAQELRQRIIAASGVRVVYSKDEGSTL